MLICLILYICLTYNARIFVCIALYLHFISLHLEAIKYLSIYLMWFLGNFYVVTRFSISKQHLVLDKICQMKDICHQYYILNRNKRSHDP